MLHEDQRAIYSFGAGEYTRSRRLQILNAPDHLLYAEVSTIEKFWGPFAVPRSAWENLLGGRSFRATIEGKYELRVTPGQDTVEAEVLNPGGERVFRDEFLSSDLRELLKALEDGL